MDEHTPSFYDSNPLTPPIPMHIFLVVLPKYNGLRRLPAILELVLLDQRLLHDGGTLNAKRSVLESCMKNARSLRRGPCPRVAELPG
jgi:hypothetical protein